MSAAHTPGSIRAAEIIIREGIDGRGKASRIQTAYGPKTREGLADLIDNETHAPELLAMIRRRAYLLACLFSASTWALCLWAIWRAFYR